MKIKNFGLFFLKIGDSKDCCHLSDVFDEIVDVREYLLGIFSLEVLGVGRLVREVGLQISLPVEVHQQVLTEMGNVKKPGENKVTF